MRHGVLSALALVTVLGACGSREPDTRRGVAALPIIGAPIEAGGTLLGRLNPFQNVVFRGDRPISRPGGGLCGVAGLEGTVIDPITSQVAGCGVAAPVRVTYVDGVKLSQAAIMDCQTAQALHQWVTKGVKPAVGRKGGGVAELQVAAHYVCRTRNHRPGAPISEHGKGRAIDIGGLTLADGERLSIRNDWRSFRHGRTLRRIHQAACGPFGTTLGPGSDGMHEDHLHFDTAQHRSGPICR